MQPFFAGGGGSDTNRSFRSGGGERLAVRREGDYFDRRAVFQPNVAESGDGVRGQWVAVKIDRRPRLDLSRQRRAIPLACVISEDEDGER